MQVNGKTSWNSLVEMGSNGHTDDFDKLLKAQRDQ